MKPNIVFSAKIFCLDEAQNALETCDIFVSVGISGTVLNLLKNSSFEIRRRIEFPLAEKS